MSKENSNKASERDKAMIKRLDTIIGVLLEAIPAEEKKLTISRRIKLLNDLGYHRVEIARILGKSTAFVGVMLNRLEKQTKKRRSR